MLHCKPWLFCALLVGCGIGDNKLFFELDQEEAAEVCAEYSPRTVDCGDEAAGVSTDIGCEAGVPVVTDSCYASVGDYRACRDAIDLLSDQALCDGLPDACAPLLSEDCQPR